MMEQRDYREPVRDRADHGGFGRRGDVEQPRVSRLEHRGADVDQRREHQQTGREQLHSLQFGHGLLR